MYSDELKFEADVVKSLIQKGWTGKKLTCPTEQDLINNWAEIIFKNNKQIDRLNDCELTDGEMHQLLEKVNLMRTPLKLNGFINGITTSIVRDNEKDTLHYKKEVTIKLFDKNEIAGGTSIYQIAEQPIFKVKSPYLNDRRGDLMLLINGIPMFHIELKREKGLLIEAENQIEKYAHEGIFIGIYSLIQVFVAMTPDETVYFANPGPDGKFKREFYFHWEDFNNEIIYDWKTIVEKLLSIPMAHQLIGYYTVADDTDGILKVMRSYQYFAANKISDVVAKTDWSNPNTRGGYIWHTTGSGKTMTSFKSAQLIANSKNADKVVFLMDRIELGTQSLEEYQGFADSKDDVAGTDNTKDLITKLKSNEPNHSLIVTSIQKMSLIEEVLGRYTNDLDIINKKRMVIIVDECHRDTFGLMMNTIKKIFPKAVFFGFTGTPIFDENKKQMSTVADVFGNELHKYVLADGIRDGNVLGFDIYQIQTFSDNDIKDAVILKECNAKGFDEIFENEDKLQKYRELKDLNMAGYEDENGNYIKGIEDFVPSVQYNSEKHREIVVENILSNWKKVSFNNKFSAILATSSISEAIEYYRLLKKKNAQEQFTFTILVDPSIDNKGDSTFKENGLEEILKDYEKTFNQPFSLKNADLFKRDVSNRLAHKKPYNMIQEKDKLGLLIVVDQMLTGFDSKWLNTLYLDKMLKFENVIQAFSRTNRVLDKNDKPFGIIKCYRKPHTMEKNIEDAVKLYSGDKPAQVFVEKLELNVENMNQIFENIKELFNANNIEDFSKLPKEVASIKRFVQLFNIFTKYLNASMIQGFILRENDSVDNNKIKSPVTKQIVDTLKQRYKEVPRINRN